MDARTITFGKNGNPLPKSVVMTNLTSPLRAAVTLYGTGEEIAIVNADEA